MSDGTSIEWTDASWNPLRAALTPHPDGEAGSTAKGWACVRVSQGCVNCYAATINKRLGTGLDYTVPALAKVATYVDKGALVKPLSWRKPRKVFVCSMTDLFGEWVSDAEIDSVFSVMHSATRHTFQVLTKRPERARAYLKRFKRSPAWDDFVTRDGVPSNEVPRGPRYFPEGWPPPNVWIGTSVENQAAADERIPHLLATPAAVRFLSCEPLLGPVDLTGLLEKAHRAWVDAAEPYCAKCRRVLETPTQRGVIECAVCHETAAVLFPNDRHSIDWVIVGGESGSRARPMDLAWARSLVEQCKGAGVAVFVKQLGSRPEFADGRETVRRVVPLKLRDRKGGSMSEWPEDLRVRDFPT